MQPSKDFNSIVDNSRYVSIFGNYNFDPSNAVLQFSYVDSNYKAYKDENVSKCYRARCTLSYGLKTSAKTAFFALKLLGRAIRASFTNSTTLLQNKLALFITIRMMEASLGYLISPINQKFGSYLLEDALVNLNVYHKISGYILEILQKK